MLAAQARLEDLLFPCVGFFKYDGFRAPLTGKGLRSRKMKPIPNIAVREWLEASGLMHLDGELIHGEHDEAVFNRTSRIISARGAPRDGVRYVVFDWFGDPAMPYRQRLAQVKMMRLPPGVVLARGQLLQNLREAAAFEREAIGLKYEGIITRALDAPYKMGRSTLKQQWMLKVKRFKDGECRVLGVFPRRRNDNEQKRNALGYAERSKKKAGMVALPEVGGFYVQEIKTGIRFKCSAGVLTQKERRELWPVRARLRRLVANVRWQEEGRKDKPRFGRFRGWRSRLDF